MHSISLNFALNIMIKICSRHGKHNLRYFVYLSLVGSVHRFVVMAISSYHMGSGSKPGNHLLNAQIIAINYEHTLQNIRLFWAQ